MLPSKKTQSISQDIYSAFLADFFLLFPAFLPKLDNFSKFKAPLFIFTLSTYLRIHTPPIASVYLRQLFLHVHDNPK